MSAAPDDRIELYWIPLGSGRGVGSRIVRISGTGYALAHRPLLERPRPVLHAGLLVWRGGHPWSIEMAPAWGPNSGTDAVAATGPVGLRRLGRWRAFRYEVRCGAGLTIPDLRYAVGPAAILAHGALAADRVVAQVPAVPRLTWGRDELRTGHMWNSNAVIAWLLASGGIDVDDVAFPLGGLAPGWRAGAIAAARGVRGGPTWT